MARTNRPDEAYHIPTLNRWFALAAFTLLITSVWMVIDDYTRPWKETQRDFRNVERARLALAKDLTTKKIDNETLAGAKQKLDAAQEELLRHSDDIDKQRAIITDLEQDTFYKAKQAYNFARASLADVRYQLEEFAKHHPKERAEIQKRMKRYDCEVHRVEGSVNGAGCPALDGGKSLREQMLDREDSLLKAKAALEQLLGKRKATQGQIDGLTGDVRTIEKRLEKLEANFFNETFRDAPLVDFLVPSLKIRQAVIKDIRDDYNFATVQKEDRCMTCHQGIDSKDYAVHPSSGRFLDAATRTVMEAEVVASLRDYLGSLQGGKELLSYVEDFTDKPEVTLDAWLTENVAAEQQIEYFKWWAWDDLEELRLRTSTYRAHPKLDLYMTSSSPHPMDKMGCTVCHEGRGHATDFNRVFHTPKNKEQEEQWAVDYGWHEPHYWDYPQLPADRVTASCAKCHDKEIKLTGGGAYTKGREIVETLGCHGCHRIDGMSGTIRKVGPSLRKLPAKVDETFAYSWIWAPRDFRPSTRMPHYFDQTNNRDPQWLSRSQQEVRGMVAYIFAKAQGFERQKPPAGDAEHGATLFREVGCLGCHSLDDDKLTVNDHGPDLSGVGSKLQAPWIYAWLKNPRAYFPETHMPSLRLSDGEAADITAYLTSLQKKGWVPIPTPGRDEALQRGLLVEALEAGMRRDELAEKLDAMTAEQRELLLGEKSLAKYGCAACHDIPGFESAGPIGTELTTWGDKFITQLDFGLMNAHGEHRDIDYTHLAWASAKLKNPRVFDQGKQKTKTYNELLKMPNFGLDAGEIHAITTFLISRKKQEVGVSARPKETPETMAVQAGRRVVRDYNCHGCHYFDDEGGLIAQYWKMKTVDGVVVPVVVAASGKPDYRFLTQVGDVQGDVPPILLDQGNKTKPEWLFDFFAEPVRLRPKLRMRMPSFAFSDKEANMLIAMFAGLEGHGVGEQSSYEPDASLAVLGQELFQSEAGNCRKCHMFTDLDPLTTPASVVAPNLKLAGRRLQATWIPRWLKDPNAIMPGTKMPGGYFLEGSPSIDPGGSLLHGDVEKGMRAITDYLIISGRTYEGAETAQR